MRVLRETRQKAHKIGRHSIFWGETENDRGDNVATTKKDELGNRRGNQRILDGKRGTERGRADEDAKVSGLARTVTERSPIHETYGTTGECNARSGDALHCHGGKRQAGFGSDGAGNRAEDANGGNQISRGKESADGIQDQASEFAGDVRGWVDDETRQEWDCVGLCTEIKQ